jgi:predicted ABC-type ATPase
VALDALERCLAGLPQTRALHSRGGAYTPERQELHRRILASTRAGAACVRGRPAVALLTGGPPGAGKSSWLMRNAPFSMRSTTLWIDADRLRSQLPEYRGWNASATQQEAGDLVDTLLKGIGQGCRTDLFYDGTMARPGRYRELIPILRALGYHVVILNVSVPEAVSRNRVLSRYRVTGRYVPRGVIAAWYSTGPATLKSLAPLADGWLQIDGVSGATLGSGGEPLPVR